MHEKQWQTMPEAMLRRRAEKVASGCPEIIRHGKRKGQTCGKPAWVDTYGGVETARCYMHEQAAWYDFKAREAARNG